MKRLLILAMTVAMVSPALAQPPAQTLTPDQTWDALFHQEAEAKAQATLQVTALQRQVADLTAKLAAATKAEAPKPEPPPQAPHVPAP